MQTAVSKLNVKLREHFKRNILPIYENADANEKSGKSANGLKHISDAMGCAMFLADMINGGPMPERVNPDAVYAIIGYHDVGRHGNAETEEEKAYNILNHAELSAGKVNTDRGILRRFFTDAEIDKIVETVAKHDTHFREYPEGVTPDIYDKIMHASDVKFDLDIELTKSFKYNRIKYPDFNFSQIAEECAAYFQRIYAPTEEARTNLYLNKDILLPNPQYSEHCDSVFLLSSDKEQFLRRLRRIADNTVIAGEDLLVINTILDR